MPSGTLTQVADAVLGLITATVQNAGGEAQRKYVPEEKVEDLVGLVVTVVPRTETRERASRSTWYQDYTVDVAVQQRAATDGEVDGLTALSETLADIIADNELASPSVSLTGLKVTAPYWPHLDTKNVYTSLITATYRGGRKRA